MGLWVEVSCYLSTCISGDLEGNRQDKSWISSLVNPATLVLPPSLSSCEPPAHSLPSSSSSRERASPPALLCVNAPSDAV